MQQTPDTAALLPSVIAAARAAGRAIMAVYRGDFEVRYKDDASPLTEADLAAQRLLQGALSSLTPAVPIVSEEAAAVPFDTRRSWPLHWLVDPLDGTRDFVARSDQFSVNVALVHQGRAVLGVVHAPVTGLTYSGGDGLRAERRAGDGPPEPIAVRPPTADELVVLTSNRHHDEATSRFLTQLRRTHRVTLRRHGSALKACLIAEGSAHLYPRLGPTWEWDTAASQAVLEAAGGVLRRAGGAAALRYGTRDLRNPPFYAAYGPGAPHP
jgi:3'(2'), 5'-bisphosphate nucleotidase